ncbi:hypothetical protein GCM10010515_50150 [Streptomyces fructofermentans]|uniref:Uncharacterized protein n=2 Tax=Streptomyces fructofermentans TaxID=152141 RepID=A0A918NKS6_9ACTN|nr:hypothetical protein GCM10010515_50150 [Streptomyces fructofermentans]
MKPMALAPRMVRQLRRVRRVYATGVALCALTLLLQIQQSHGLRQTAVVGVLLGVFTLLLAFTAMLLWRHRRTAHCGTAKRLSPSWAR